MERIKVEGIASSYGKKQVLKQVSFVAEAGTCTALVGANGCGKSTLLKILTGLRTPRQGSISFDGIELTGRERKKQFLSYVGYVPQESNLLPELTVKDNLLLWHQDRLALEYTLQNGFLHRLGLQDMLLLRAGNLSGGMKKRVSIGCAVAGNPPILLLDEPNAALDLPGKADIRSYLSFYKEHGGTIIMATHEETDLELCEQVLCLRDGICYPIEKTLRGQALLKEIRFQDAEDKNLVSNRI